MFNNFYGCLIVCNVSSKFDVQKKIIPDLLHLESDYFGVAAYEFHNPKTVGEAETHYTHPSRKGRRTGVSLLNFGQHSSVEDYGQDPEMNPEMLCDNYGELPVIQPGRY